MSKGSLFWGNASGKLGESVFYRANGEQRNRTYVAKIKNPKTLAQMRNRITMANLVSMYRSLKPILALSFPQKATKLSGFNAFVKSNKASLPYGITKSMLEGGMYCSLGTRVAQGDIALSMSPKQIPYLDPSELSAPPRFSFQLTSGAGLAMEVANYGDFAETITGGDIYRILTANGNPLGLPVQFKVTLLWGSVDINAMTDGAAEGTTPMCYRSYVCSVNSTDVGSYVGAPAYENECKLLPIVTEFDAIASSNGANIVVDGLRVGSAMMASEGDSDVFALIVSYNGADGLHCNNAFVYGGTQAAQAATDFLPNGFVYDQVLTDSGYSADSVLTTTAAQSSISVSDFVAPLEQSDDEGEEEEP